MHYVAFVEGREKQVEIVEVAPDRYQITIDDRVMAVDARHTDETSASLLVDHEAFSIESDRVSAHRENLKVRGEVVSVEVLDLRTVQLRRAQETAAAAGGAAQIISPMPGKVIAVLVKEGAEVQEGQGVVVIEAMKMENELVAPKSGVMKSLTVAEGDAVDGGMLLGVVE